MKDTFHNLKAVAAIAPAVKTDTEDGAAIDLRGFNSALVVVNTGAIVSAGNFGFKLQESDTTTSEDFDDVAADDILGTAPASGMSSASVYTVGYIGKKRYIRVVTIDGGGTSVAIGAVAILGHPALAPVA